MDNKYQKNQYMTLMQGQKGEASKPLAQGCKLSVALLPSQSPSKADLMETICERENLFQALKRVKQNKGSPGIDGMTVDELGEYLKANWLEIKEQLLRGQYKPQPVKRVEIPKAGGKTRKLGIPTALDRFIQQAILQPLQKYIDPTFSESSYGFRPKRSAHQAITKAQQYIAQGYRYVVDIDLEQFFDRVNHDKLMSELAKRIHDKRVLKLIRAYLTSGILENGLITPSKEGTVQGGPISPLLSNIMLDLLDKELEKRGHKFCRFADDCNIYVKSDRAGQRVMKSLCQYIEVKLKLKVNQLKSAVAKVYTRAFLGFSFTSNIKHPKKRISPKAIRNFRDKIKKLTIAGKGKRMEAVMSNLTKFIRGWLAYYGHCETPSTLTRLESWLHRRLRCAYWRQWKTGSNRAKQLRIRKVGHQLARQTAGTNKGPWNTSKSPALSYALPNAYFKELGLPRMVIR